MEQKTQQRLGVEIWNPKKGGPKEANDQGLKVQAGKSKTGKTGESEEEGRGAEKPKPKK